MELSLVGAEGYDEASDLVYEVDYSVGFLIGGMGSKLASAEGCSLRASQGPHGCPGGGFPFSSLDSSGRLAAT